jgi:undecaprenyl-diphosphatase
VAELPLRHAIALGLLQGPTELLPVSSSGHAALLPWLADWPIADLEPELLKAFEVALHTGTAAAFAIIMREDLSRSLRGMDRRGVTLVALSFLPAALVGGLLERTIEQRFSGPRVIAVGLLLGGIAMSAADARGTDSRVLADAGALDGLLLGVAQSAALIPGVSRNGATLTAARLRGFARADAAALSWRVALPVILGATALKTWRLAQRGVPAQLGPALAVGGGSAFVSTLLCAPMLKRGRRGRALAPYALYRALLALVVTRRLMRRPLRR